MSSEVLTQVTHDLTSLYLRVKRGGGSSYQHGLTTALSRLADQPGQALQVAFVLGSMVVTPIRGSLDLADPDAGIVFGTNTEPRCSDFAAAQFINQMLRGEYGDAGDTFQDLVENHEPQEVFAFLGFLLAMAATA
jgi:hypothetical protein